MNDPGWIDKLKQIAPDIVVVAAYGHILTQRILDVPRLDCINLHASLLPRHRGSSPIAAAILAGDSHSGVTVIRMAPRLDAGDMIASQSTPIGPQQTAGELHDVLALIAAELLLETVAAFQQGRVVYTVQDETEATYCTKLDKSAGEINWDRPAELIQRHIRAMTPWPGAFGNMNGQRITVLQSEAVMEPSDEPPGTVLAASAQAITVAARSGRLLLKRLKPASGRPMTAAEYLNGRSVRPGDRFEAVG